MKTRFDRQNEERNRKPLLLFGPAGVPKKASKRDSEAGIARVEKVGLDCMELEFVRGVSMGEKKAAQVKAASEEYEISLTVHAPYYINLNSTDPEIVGASKKRLFDAARMGALCGAESIAFHPGYYKGESPSKTLRRVKKHLKDVLRKCISEGLPIQLRPETTGKPSQFGRLEEVLALSSELEGVWPCIDFAHLHSYDGNMNSYDEFAAVLDKIGTELGPQALKDMHIHVSGIHFGQKGEIKHLNLAESDFDYISLLRALKDFSVGGKLICESPNRESDALLMKGKYKRFKKRRIRNS
jgi:deoxyribonuclease-4